MWSLQDAAELRVQDIPRNHGGILAVSQSGETRDVLKGELIVYLIVVYLSFPLVRFPSRPVLYASCYRLDRTCLRLTEFRRPWYTPGS